MNGWKSAQVVGAAALSTASFVMDQGAPAPASEARVMLQQGVPSQQPRQRQPGRPTESQNPRQPNQPGERQVPPNPDQRPVDRRDADDPSRQRDRQQPDNRGRDDGGRRIDDGGVIPGRGIVDDDDDDGYDGPVNAPRNGYRSNGLLGSDGGYGYEGYDDRFRRADDELRRIETRMDETNAQLLRRLGEARQLEGERKLDAMASVLQDMLQEQQSLIEYLARARQNLYGEAEMEGEDVEIDGGANIERRTGDSGRRGNDPDMNSGRDESRRQTDDGRDRRTTPAAPREDRRNPR